MCERLADLSALMPASAIKSIGAALTTPTAILPIANTPRPVTLDLALNLSTLDDFSSPLWPNASRKRRKAS
ncbi:hypothetical protein KPH14_012494 [Odynerus spinipes]|uniref:Uncharacterized protein n=1 Tax=Odynerus spinipes TaxID=1348599 RepID=A0AAD9RIS9_9HYME|nr:hypothetical protein KPH14_012494 [Odynerus spinipes]